MKTPFYCYPCVYKPMVEVYQALPVMPSIEDIIAYVGRALSINPQQIIDNNRDGDVSDARHIAIKLIKRYHPKLFLREIGQILGGRHHSTIIYCLNQFNDLYEYDRNFKKKYRRVILEMEGGRNV